MSDMSNENPRLLTMESPLCPFHTRVQFVSAKAWNSMNPVKRTNYYLFARLTSMNRVRRVFVST